ncbi:hypothetical protein ASAP_0567 [Asaia bogorensis]|uniref:Uncharacterized protein n=1 Tax=Asaia bogorensis TaxID=91915 RepID=A0A060QIL4_9PROT|nr:hypothetical protein ASAP_0567 [Asaia bogorensis]
MGRERTKALQVHPAQGSHLYFNPERRFWSVSRPGTPGSGHHVDAMR